jgi:hypothetical protein
MAQPNPVWAHFFKGKNHYKNNKSYYEVWCRACTRCSAHVTLSRELDAVASGQLHQARTEEEIEQSCMYLKLYRYVHFVD